MVQNYIARNTKQIFMVNKSNLKESGNKKSGTLFATKSKTYYSLI